MLKEVTRIDFESILIYIMSVKLVATVLDRLLECRVFNNPTTSIVLG